MVCILTGLLLFRAVNAIPLFAIVSHAAITKAPQRLSSGQMKPFHMTPAILAEIALIGSWRLIALLRAYQAFELFARFVKVDFARRPQEIEMGVTQTKSKLSENE